MIDRALNGSSSLVGCLALIVGCSGSGDNSVASSSNTGGTGATTVETTVGGRLSGDSQRGGETAQSTTVVAGANNGGTQALVSSTPIASSHFGGGTQSDTTAKNFGGQSTGGKNTGSASGGKSFGTAGTGGASSNGGMSSGSGGCLDGPAVVVPAGYKLVWSDEFNTDGAPDPANYGFESGFVRNEEAQYYQPDNAFVEKGCLIIEARRERKTNPNYKASSSDWKTSRQYADYTSSSLRTMGKHSWLYGRFEMRGRIKTQAGLWPAWWTLGVEKEWPSNGEIDIMEYYAGKIRANVACGTATRWEAKWDGAAWDVATFEDKNWQDKFHVWRMDWDDKKISLYLDDKLVNDANLSDMLNSDGSSPFKQPHYLLLNLAIGGNNGGDPSKTAFPNRFEVDYVRVFQK